VLFFDKISRGISFTERLIGRIVVMTFSEKAVSELLKSGELGELLDKIFSRE
jgi:hypothetical protein